MNEFSYWKSNFNRIISADKIYKYNFDMDLWSKLVSFSDLICCIKLSMFFRVTSLPSGYQAISQVLPHYPECMDKTYWYQTIAMHKMGEQIVQFESVELTCEFYWHLCDIILSTNYAWSGKTGTNQPYIRVGGDLWPPWRPCDDNVICPGTFTVRDI